MALAPDGRLQVCANKWHAGYLCGAKRRAAQRLLLQLLHLACPACLTCDEAVCRPPEATVSRDTATDGDVDPDQAAVVIAPGQQDLIAQHSHSYGLGHQSTLQAAAGPVMLRTAGCKCSIPALRSCAYLHFMQVFSACSHKTLESLTSSTHSR